MKPKYLSVLITILILAWYGLFLCQRIDLTTADLGRHLKNGQLLFANLSWQNPLLNTNYYSYSEPDYQTINHHWLSGLVFFVIYRFCGFLGVHLFFIVLSLLAFWLFFRIAEEETGLSIACVLSLLLVPLIAERIEVRPEVFSYVFCGLFFTLLRAYSKKQKSFGLLFLLPFLQLFWTNLHILFILGPILSATFALEALVKKDKRKDFLKLTAIFVLVALATLANPFGPKGSLAIFTVLQDYGYRLVENQPIWFLEKLGFIVNPNFLLFKIIFFLLLASFALAVFVDKGKVSLASLILGLGFSAAGFLALRNLTVFGFFSLPLIAGNLKIILQQKPLPVQIRVDFFSFSSQLLFVCLGLAFLIFSLVSQQQKFLSHDFGFGLLAGNNQAIRFFEENHLQGPIFNNYDIGGYLIFYLFPQEKVFVDNRPEAYSSVFFQEQYIPYQQEPAAWESGQEKYGFNAIFFSHRDATPWGQQFLVSRVQDPAWAPVYYDDYSIIFLKRAEENAELIRQYEIPRNFFKIQ